MSSGRALASMFTGAFDRVHHVRRFSNARQELRLSREDSPRPTAGSREIHYSRLTPPRRYFAAVLFALDLQQAEWACSGDCGSFRYSFTNGVFIRVSNFVFRGSDVGHPALPLPFQD